MNLKQIPFMIAFLIAILHFSITPPTVFAQSPNCNASQFDFTNSYTLNGDVNTTCNSGDCQAERLALRGGVFRLTCWPQGSPPAGTHCEGECIITASGRSCEQTGCVGVTEGGNPRSPAPDCHCEVPSPASSLACGNVCRNSNECPTECPYCAGGGSTPLTCQILPGRTGGEGCTVEQDNNHQFQCWLNMGLVYCADAESCTKAQNKEASVNGQSGPPPISRICNNILDPTAKEKCCECLGGCSSNPEENDSDNGIWTALGCIPTSPEGFTGTLLTIAISIGGGLALLLMIYGAFLMATSGGNPETAQKGKQVFGGAIMGLLFIIFSVVLLRIIGVDILQIPSL